MTLEELKKRIEEEIKGEQHDDERAHGNEDDLRHEVLEAIANGVPNAQELALEVLKTSKIDFSRWCA